MFISDSFFENHRYATKNNLFLHMNSESNISLNYYLIFVIYMYFPIDRSMISKYGLAYLLA